MNYVTYCVTTVLTIQFRKRDSGGFSDNLLVGGRLKFGQTFYFYHFLLWKWLSDEQMTKVASRSLSYFFIKIDFG